MAVDTRAKRQSATCMLVPSMLSSVYPSDAGVIQAEWQAVPWMYSGIKAVGAVTVIVAAATMAYAGQAVVANSRTIVAITGATMAYAGQALVVLEETYISITGATMVYTGRALSTGAEVAKGGLRMLGHFLTTR